MFNQYDYSPSSFVYIFCILTNTNIVYYREMLQDWLEKSVYTVNHSKSTKHFKNELNNATITPTASIYLWDHFKFSCSTLCYTKKKLLHIHQMEFVFIFLFIHAKLTWFYINRFTPVILCRWVQTPPARHLPRNEHKMAAKSHKMSFRM